MFNRNFSQKSVGIVIENQFPHSVMLSWWTPCRVVTIHYLARGNEMFCCAHGQWWKIEYHEYECDRGEEGIELYSVIDRVMKIDPPEDVTYSHSIAVVLEEGDKLTDGCFIGGEMGYDLCLDCYPPVRAHS
ncbi:MAG TPA: hypothetical protein VMR46_01955 [Candidatus Paceibacterota bacterium]|jgi:hypothetical protein|nr:hypothetical protein [Candidatus Paceibacterota bacterium]